MFRDYSSTYEQHRKLVRESGCPPPCDQSDFRAVYDWEIAVQGKKDERAVARLCIEAHWYSQKRPFFNVYPVIARKLMQLDESINLENLKVPFGCIEVRTNSLTMLLGDLGKWLLLSVDFPKSHQLFFVDKRNSINSALGAGRVSGEPSELFPGGDLRSATEGELSLAMFLSAGVCLLPNDNKIVQPVVLNCHRKEKMTDEEWRDYAERAAKRNGRRGFEVGRDIERMPPSCHYRNGGLYMKAHGKNWSERTLDWRNGAVVNGDKPPEVPTGFKDAG